MVDWDTLNEFAAATENEIIEEVLNGNDYGENEETAIFGCFAVRTKKRGRSLLFHYLINKIKQMDISEEEKNIGFINLCNYFGYNPDNFIEEKIVCCNCGKEFELRRVKLENEIRCPVCLKNFK